MGRPPRHTADELLDAAVRLFATGGPEAVTMSAVAREAGAPSGSVYHRFPGRPALQAALWLRTVQRFHRDYLAVLCGERPLDAAVAAVRWCRERPGEAQVLYAGKRLLGASSWSAEDRAEDARYDAALDEALRIVVRRLRAETGSSADELLLVLVDLPYAVVRRYLAQGRPPPESAVDLVARVARTMSTKEGTNDG
ncbi:TetR/AcrR family transcriptional regulator [Amycolatopsis viridis]|uniref:AcrR family transcriptional regulator n=1 Tax=Amycolatopsis viridis TaxID=185678 RepID=A0ABX0STU0_9PSEU|nr:TetR/AcrR family transcriptional regulator [Amycolatopsis viridis]NIH79049.1 AcrR family transcriptional regulator [Amycolatopsis viridis]